MDDMVIWGAGAIGGTIGAYLARAGKPALLVDQDAAHVAALNAKGLTITGPIGEFTVPVRAVTPDQVKGPLTRVMLAVKGQHSDAASRVIAPLLAADGSILSLQNGLNGDAIGKNVGADRVLLALVNFASDYIEPGVIHYGGRGAVYVGEPDGRITARVRDYVALLKSFDDAIEASDNVAGLLWGKVAYGGLLIATALTNDTMAEVLGDARWHDVLARSGGEIVLAARAAGVAPVGVDGFDAEAFARHDDAKIAASCDLMAEHYRHSAKTRSGIWRDLAVRKRKTEVDAQIAIIAPIAGKHGLKAPITTRLVTLIHDIEDGRRPLDRDNLDRLAEAIPADA